MLLQQENPTLSSNFDWVYQALSPMEETCKFSAACDYPACGKWFCLAHAEDQAWHRGAPDASDEATREDV
jgi:hypothetical protein